MMGNTAFFYGVSLPKTNIVPENRPQKEISSSNHPFSGAMLVLGSVGFVWWTENPSFFGWAQQRSIFW